MVMGEEAVEGAVEGAVHGKELWIAVLPCVLVGLGFFDTYMHTDKHNRSCFVICSSYAVALYQGALL
jgi:hypothetical protein